MTRSLWKIPFVYSAYFFKKVRRKKKKRDIFVTKRGSLIPLTLKDRRCQVYNGKKYFSLKVRADHVGHKFGEFSFTKVTGMKTHLPDEDEEEDNFFLEAKSESTDGIRY